MRTMPVMPFGKHEGKPLDKVPRGYFQWLLANATNLTDSLREDLECIVKKEPLPMRPTDEPDTLEKQLQAAMRKNRVHA